MFFFLIGSSFSIFSFLWSPVYCRDVLLTMLPYLQLIFTLSFLTSLSYSVTVHIIPMMKLDAFSQFQIYQGIGLPGLCWLLAELVTHRPTSICSLFPALHLKVVTMTTYFPVISMQITRLQRHAHIST